MCQCRVIQSRPAQGVETITQHLCHAARMALKSDHSWAAILRLSVAIAGGAEQRCYTTVIERGA